jgi:hypothetical protein
MVLRSIGSFSVGGSRGVDLRALHSFDGIERFHDRRRARRAVDADNFECQGVGGGACHRRENQHDHECQ